MKKLLAGCLVILVLGVVVFVAGSYFLYRAASPMIQNAREFLAGATELEQLDKQITNQASYAAPANNELTEAQVQRFIRVQENVRKTLGQRVDEIEAKYQHLKGNQQRELTVTEAFTAFSEMINVLVQARRVQVNALNQEGFSQQEYAWVRDRVFQAAGYEVASQIDFKKLEEAVRQGAGGSLDDLETPDLPQVDVPERNRALVKPHAGKIGEWLPLVFFGL